jgi:hypothetical protein
MALSLHNWLLASRVFAEPILELRRTPQSECVFRAGQRAAIEKSAAQRRSCGVPQRSTRCSKAIERQGSPSRIRPIDGLLSARLHTKAGSCRADTY